MIAGAKRKMESEMGTLHGDLDEMASEAHLSEEKAKKAMVDAARLADELRMEQELALACERDCKLFECQVKDMQARLDEAETNALKGGKKAMNKMEGRIRELESEVDAEARRCGDAHKNLRKSERRILEITYASDEDRKNHERMQGLIDQLQSKIKSYKKQIEEAEEIAALNLAKFRQAQAHLEMLHKALTSMNKLWLRLSKGDVLDPLVLCKWMMGAKFSSTCTGPAALLRFTSNLIGSKISDAVVVAYDNKY